MGMKMLLMVVPLIVVVMVVAGISIFMVEFVVVMVMVSTIKTLMVLIIPVHVIQVSNSRLSNLLVPLVVVVLGHVLFVGWCCFNVITNDNVIVILHIVLGLDSLLIQEKGISLFFFGELFYFFVTGDASPSVWAVSDNCLWNIITVAIFWNDVFTVNVFITWDYHSAFLSCLDEILISVEPYYSLGTSKSLAFLIFKGPCIVDQWHRWQVRFCVD